MKNINDMILEAIRSPQMMREEADKMLEIQYLHSEYEGNIDENIFISLILQSQKGRNRTDIQFFLASLVASADSIEITNRVFSLLLRSKGKYRYTILSGLAHQPLAYYQLITLNKMRIEEALVQLVEMYVCYDCFIKYDLLDIFHPWENKLTPYICESIEYCIAHHHTNKADDVRVMLTSLNKTGDVLSP